MIRKFISFLLLFFIILYNFYFTFANEELPIIDSNNIENTESGTTIELINTIPEILITFQSASYLIDKDTVKETYNCDLNKDECKVNFDLSDTFWWYVPAKFACINDFSFITWEENKCNPNTIIFPPWNHTIKFKIYEKDNPSNYKEKSITIINDKIVLIPIQPISNSWWENEVNTWSTDTNSWNIFETWSWETDIINDSENIFSGWLSSNGSGSSFFDQIPNIIEIPNVDIEIQSWLELVNTDYICKNIDCKINLNLEKLFTWIYDISKYACLWDFGSGTFATADTDKKCNPWYVNYWTWIFEVIAKIYEKNNLNNFKTWSLIFYNWTNQENIYSNLLNIGNWSQTWSNNANSWIINPNSNTSLQNNSKLILPNIKISFQNPTYLNEKDIEKNEYFCDNSKWDCKVNIDLSESFSWFITSNYICNIIFPFEILSESEKCNPNTIIFPIWENIVYFYIKDKSDETNFTWKTIKILNHATWLWVASVWLASSNSVTSNQTKNIIIQSWANKIWDNLYACNEEKCRINLKYENISNETCLWDFSWWIYKESYKTTCNPSYVYYFSWLHKVWLKIYKNWNFSEEKSITLKNDFYDLWKKNNISPTAKIKLQWRLSKDKELIWNTLICRNTKECSVNFDWSDSTDANMDNLDFFWDFWNWKYAEKSNPTSIEYLPWKYKIRLKVVDRFWDFSEDYFFVEVYESVEKIEEINQDIIDFIRITEVLPNPIGKEEYEWIKIKNNSINFVNIKWLEIDDRLWIWSKSYKIEKDNYLLPFQEKKFYKIETKLNLNNSFDEINLIYNSKIIDSLSWNYEVPEDFVVKKEIREIVKVLKVIDWDTLVIQFQDWKTEKLRLIWVDTPETKHPKKEVEKFWIEVSNYTKELLNWKEVYLELDYENYRDKYGRLLGYIWLQEVNFNKLLIEKWYARAYLYFPFKYKEDFEKAEKEAKKNKLWIWGNNELKKEMDELKKIEDKQIIKNISFYEWLNFKNIIWKISNLNDSNNIKIYFLWIIPKYDKKSIEKEALWEFEVLLSELLPESNKKVRKTKLKQEKIITYKTSKLKSGLKITWTTFPNAKITLSFDELKYETISDNLWKYSFLISDNLKVGDYKLDFLVLSWEKVYNYDVQKSINLSRDYIFWVQDYKVKKATKKTKTKKSKKTKKKKVLANNITKKMKYDVKDIKKEEDKSPSKNIIYIFIISLITSFLWYFVIKWKN